MNAYSLSIGDSSKEALGLAASVNADTPEEAIALLLEAFPEDSYALVRYTDNKGCRGVTFASFYINHQHITVLDIFDQEEA